MIKTIRSTPRASLALALLSSCAVGAGSLTNPYAEVIQLREVEADPQTGLVTLRWNSQSGRTYSIEETANPQFGWQESVRDISGDPIETTFTLLPQPANYGAKTMLFRVRESEENLQEKNDVRTTSAVRTTTSATIPAKKSNPEEAGAIWAQLATNAMTLSSLNLSVYT